MDNSLKATNLRKVYKDKEAVKNVSFHVGKGEVVGLLGPNGAGKTTIIQMLLSVLTPSEGSIEIFGKDYSGNEKECLASMNFATSYSMLPYNLTCYENLKVFSLYYGIRNAKEIIEELLIEFDLTQFRNTKTGGLSSGEQMRLALAKAFLNDPKLLLLDEPTSSLDPAVARQMRERILARMNRIGGSILWTSHNMREVENVTDRVIFLHQGNIVADGTPDELKKEFNSPDLEEIFVTLANRN